MTPPRPQTSAESLPTDAAATLHDKLGFWSCTALVIGNVIGMGIFVLPASLAPFGYNALLGWLAVTVGCIALAAVFSRLAHALPDADGPQAYIRTTLGEVPAFVAVWTYWISLWMTNAALATGVVGYLAALFPPLRALPPLACALALLWLVVLVNWFGVRTGGRVQIVTSVLKLLPMVAIALLGAWLLLASPGSYTAQPITTPLSLSGLTAASTIALYAMLGVESASVPAARVRDPARTIPRATMTGTLVTAGVYIVVSAVPLLLLGENGLAQAAAPFAVVMDRFAFAGSGRWLALFVVISGLGALNGWTLLAGELTRTMAVNGVLPPVLARNNVHGAPATALVVTGVLASCMIGMSYSKSLVSAFTFLTQVVTAANLPLYLCCALALLVMLRRQSRQPAARRAWIAAVIALAFVIFAFVGTGREPFLYALALAAVGLPLYAWMRSRARRAAGVMQE